MFCEKCGTQVPDTATKCENCGNEFGQQANSGIQLGKTATVQQNVEQLTETAQQNIMQQTTGAATPKKPMDMKKIGMLVAALAVVLIVLVFVFTRKTTVDLNKYIAVEFTGYDTVGKASYEFDLDAFEDDYKEKMKYTKDGKDDLEEEVTYTKVKNSQICEIFSKYFVRGNLDVTTGLTNGDVVVFEWDLDEEYIAEFFDVKVKYSPIEFTVEGLEKATALNPFDNIQVAFTGISPNGQVQIEKTSTDGAMGSVYFEATPTSGLKNGDKVTVKVSGAGDNDYYANNYGVVLSELEKEYTVEGLNSYAQSASEISEDMMNKMKKQAEDSFYAMTTDWVDDVSVSSMDYIGNYFLKPKFADSYSYNNCIYMVYKVSTLFENEYHSEKLSFYYYVKFENIMITADGTVSVDLSNYSAPSTWNGFRHEYRWGNSWRDEQTLSYPGYEDLDTMFNKLVTSQISDYDYENNVTDIQETVAEEATETTTEVETEEATTEETTAEE